MNNNKLKVMIVIGTRPEIIKLSAIIKKCDNYFNLQIVHTGQNYDYELNKVFFEDLQIRQPDFYLNVVGDNLGQTMGNIISKSYELFLEQRPDAVVIIGDTNSCLCVIAAKRLKIPIFHLEAGNRCRDENLPEEVIRRIVDITSDINLCYSENARQYLLASDIKPEYIFITGSPMQEVLNNYIKKIDESKILEKLNLIPKKYILLSAHRENNIDDEVNFLSLMNTINAMAEKYKMPIFYSCHPRSRKMIERRDFKFDKRVIQHQPLGFFDYNNLQRNAFCVVSDSGTLAEEASYFGFPAVSIRTSTEHQELVERGVFIVGGITKNSVLQAIDLAVGINKEKKSKNNFFSNDDVSTCVIKIIQSYVGIVNKMIWRKA